MITRILLNQLKTASKNAGIQCILDTREGFLSATLPCEVGPNDTSIVFSFVIKNEGKHLEIKTSNQDVQSMTEASFHANCLRVLRQLYPGQANIRLTAKKDQQTGYISVITEVNAWTNGQTIFSELDLPLAVMLAAMNFLGTDYLRQTVLKHMLEKRLDTLRALQVEHEVPVATQIVPRSYAEVAGYVPSIMVSDPMMPRSYADAIVAPVNVEIVHVMQVDPVEPVEPVVPVVPVVPVDIEMVHVIQMDPVEPVVPVDTEMVHAIQMDPVVPVNPKPIMSSKRYSHKPDRVLPKDAMMTEGQLKKAALKFEILDSIEQCLELIKTIVQRENPERLTTVMKMFLLRVNDLYMFHVCENPSGLKAGNSEYLRAQIMMTTGPACFEEAVHAVMYGVNRDYMLTSLQLVALIPAFMNCIERQFEHA